MIQHLVVGIQFGEQILEWIEIATLAIEILAVVVIVVAIVHGLAHYLFRAATHPEEDGYQQLKVRLGKALLLGIEILVAADIVSTVTLRETLQSLLGLGLLVLIRTFLSWSLAVEIEGRWPWQPERRKQ